MKIGEEVVMLVRGAGVVSKETRIIEDIIDGVIHLEESNKKFDAKTGKEIDPDTQFSFGFTFKLEI